MKQRWKDMSEAERYALQNGFERGQTEKALVVRKNTHIGLKIKEVADFLVKAANYRIVW